MAVCYYISSGIYSAISSSLQFKTVQSLLSVFVSILSLALRRRIVLLSIPHFSLNQYVMEGKRCAFTGHRPKNLPWGYNKTDKDCQAFKAVLNAQIIRMVEAGVTNFLSGMALGVDTWTAQSVLALREKNPALKLHCILPCKTQADRCHLSSKNAITQFCSKRILPFIPAAHITQTVCLTATVFLIEQADIVLVVYNDKPQSGTGVTVSYAQQPGRKVIVINPLSGST